MMPILKHLCMIWLVAHHDICRCDPFYKCIGCKLKQTMLEAVCTAESSVQRNNAHAIHRIEYFLEIKIFTCEQQLQIDGSWYFIMTA